jgi:hypothetical protein
MPAFLALAVLQLALVVVDAPYNADHWLLIAFVNFVAIGTALRLWRSFGEVSPTRLMASLVPSAKLLFLICYGFAALSKYNTDFLFSETSAARELLKYQIGATPVMAWFVWPPAAPWIAIGCETAVPLLLLFGRTRHIGILTGVLFHAALVISPAVKVYDFTLTVYMLLYLFAPSSFEESIRTWLNRIRRDAPDVCAMVAKCVLPLIILSPIALLAWSVQAPLSDVAPQWVRMRWLVAMCVVVGVGGLLCIGLYSGQRSESTRFRLPQGILPYAVFLLAFANGLSPYLGYKTQGSFTMFSNLRTEHGIWNHLLIPRSMRFVDQYQDRLVRIVASDDTVLHDVYAKQDLLATEFEVRRRAMKNPSLSMTIQQGDRVVVIPSISSDPIFGSPLSTLARKLLVFRPVTPDGRPFVTN